MANLVNVWRIIPINERSEMRKDAALDIALNAGRIFVGWGAIGNMVSNRIDDTDELEKALKHAYPNEHNINNGIRALRNFGYLMLPGDIVLLIGNTKSAVCVVCGEYEHGDSSLYGLPKGYDHQRQIRVISRDAQDVENVERQCSKFEDSQYVTVRKSRYSIDASTIVKSDL